MNFESPSFPLCTKIFRKAISGTQPTSIGSNYSFTLTERLSIDTIRNKVCRWYQRLKLYCCLFCPLVI